MSMQGTAATGQIEMGFALLLRLVRSLGPLLHFAFFFSTLDFLDFLAVACISCSVSSCNVSEGDAGSVRMGCRQHLLSPSCKLPQNSKLVRFGHRL